MAHYGGDARGTATDPRAGLDNPWLSSFRIVSVYAAFSLLWITLGDRVLARLTRDPDVLHLVSTLKGWIFVMLTSGVLLWMVRRAIAAMHKIVEANSANTDLLRGIFESSALGIVVVRSSGIYERVNPAFATFLGRKEGDIVGHHFSEFTFEEDTRRSEDLYGQLSDGESKQLSIEKRYVRADGSIRWALLSVALLSAGDHAFAVGVVKDITVRKAEEIRLKETLEELRDTNEKRRRLLTALLKAEETEQSRIASDIHDDSLQLMASAAMTLDLLGERLHKPQDLSDLERASGLIRTSIGRLRKMVFELKPPQLETKGLPFVLEQMLQEMAATDGLRYELRSPPSVDLSPELKLLLYKVAREALHNIRKHACASFVSIHVSERKGGVLFEIRDDGNGFDPELPRHHHFGLEQMRDRIQAARGSIQLHAVPGEGVQIHCWLPHRIDSRTSDEAA